MKELEDLKEGIDSLNYSNQKILEELKRITGDKEVWHDVTETCSKLKCSTRTLQKYRDDDIIPFSQIGAKIYFRESDIQEFLNRHNTNPDAK
jgi:hypothetical protein